MTEFDPAQIKPEMNLAADLGMDSLDIAEVSIFLQDNFDVTGVPFNEITTVGKVMALGARQITYKDEGAEEEAANISRWYKSRGPHRRLYVADGETIPEVFFNICEQMGKDVACADMRSGILTYKQMKMRAILISNYIRNLPGEYIGILLPASVGAGILILAVQMAGKIPLMVNWTVGPRHLESVKQTSKVQCILTSWAFIDKLENVDLNGIEDQLIMLEDVRHQLGLMDKLKALAWSYLGTKSLLKKLKIDNLHADSQAVLLFTSGTESMPKGVPLTHNNILSNQRALLQGIDINSDDILLSILPPFHSFGFTITGLLCIVAGVKSAFSPDPTDGPRLVQAIVRWGATIMGGTPTFIKAIMKVSQPEQFKTVRFCFTGAEKASAELFKLMSQFGKDNFLLEGYGITECSPVLTFNLLERPHRGVGLAAPGVELCVVHPETMQLLPTGSQGLILAHGPNVFSGYLNPGLSSPFVELQGKQWYKTGDLGFLDEEGYLTISGRMKRFVKIGAEMISLAAVEEGLLQEGIKKGWPVMTDGPAIAVCARETPNEKTKLYLFTSFEISLDDINKAMKDAGFSNIVRITNVMVLPTIPVMGTGKTNYRVLETEYMPKMEEKKEQINSK